MSGAPRAARSRLGVVAVLAASCALLAACDSLPGRPTPEERALTPAEVKDFAVLFGENCAGCHGADGRFGAATPLNDPVYLGIASDDVIRGAVRTGIPGTAMPPFAISQGGTLTDAQIDILVRDIRSRWAQSPKLASLSLPPYAGDGGDAARGTAAYATYCAACHGAEGTGGPRGGSVVNAAYLALVSNQALRTTVIAGRPDLGMPDWRGTPGGRAMSNQDVSDVVAWLAAQRKPFPGGSIGEARTRN